MSKRFALTIFRYHPYGGAQRDMLRIANALTQLGASVDIFTMDWRAERPETMGVHTLPCKAFSNHGKIRSFVQKLQALELSKQYDCVFGFNKMPGLDLYFAADKCFIEEVRKKHPLARHIFPRYRFYAKMEEQVYQNGNGPHILLINPSDKQVFQHWYHTEDSRFSLLSPGIALDRKCPADQVDRRVRTRKQLGISDSCTMMLMVGSDFVRKGVARSIEALAKLSDKPDWHLFVAGKGNPSKYIALAKKLSIAERVTFLGPREDIVELYAAADILLHPAREETAGVVLIEAIEAGLPQIVSGVCGYAPYIKESKGGVVLSEPFSSDEMTEQIYRLLSLAERQKCRSHCFTYKENHNLFGFIDEAISIAEKFSR